MISVLAAALLLAVLGAMGSAIARLVTLGAQAEDALAAAYLEAVHLHTVCAYEEDPEWDDPDWEWRLRMASLPEAYWY